MRKQRWSRALALLPSAAFAQVDGSWTFGTVGNQDYRLDAVSSPALFAGTLPAGDPTLTLTLGERYQVVVAAGHPLTIISKADAFGSDVRLLQQGTFAASLEADPEIGWVDAGGIVEFTVTQTLVDAMSSGGRIPGYRCGAHPANMRGNFAIAAPPVIPLLDARAWTALAALLLGLTLSLRALRSPPRVRTTGAPARARRRR
jgi:hypothetical protein